MMYDALVPGDLFHYFLMIYLRIFCSKQASQYVYPLSYITIILFIMLYIAMRITLLVIVVQIKTQSQIIHSNNELLIVPNVLYVRHCSELYTEL